MDYEKDIKELLKNGKPIYVSNVVDGKKQWANITCENDRLHIYSLRCGNLPDDGTPFPLETIHEMTPKESPVIFLDIGWRGKVKGRLYVRMFGNTPRGRKAVLLCSGEKGRSYKGTRFLFCYNGEGNVPYSIHSGTYPVENSQIGHDIVDDIVDSDEYVHQVRAGLFCCNGGCLDGFFVYLEDSSDMEDSAFGIVEQGLDVLKKVAKISLLSDASVMECGVVVPM